jgi:hypothetical protein
MRPSGFPSSRTHLPGNRGSYTCLPVVGQSARRHPIRNGPSSESNSPLKKGVCALEMPVFSGRCVEFRQRAAGALRAALPSCKTLSVCSSRLWLIRRKARRNPCLRKTEFHLPSHRAAWGNLRIGLPCAAARSNRHRARTERDVVIEYKVTRSCSRLSLMTYQSSAKSLGIDAGDR